MTGKCFIDSNIWIYLLTDDDPAKAEHAGVLLSDVRQKVVSWQVVNEICANLIRKKGRDESYVRTIINFICESCEMAELTLPLLEEASHLRARYLISFWDSLIVVAALAAGCDTLISEDMQNGQRYGRLTVRNIFV